MLSGNVNEPFALKFHIDVTTPPEIVAVAVAVTEGVFPAAGVLTTVGADV